MPDPHYFLGVILKRNGRYEEAYRQYKKALELQKRLADIMIYKTALAGTLLKMERYHEAQEIITEVEKTQTKNRKVLYNLAARYCELNQLDKALSLAGWAVEFRFAEWSQKVSGKGDLMEMAVGNTT